MHLAFNGWPLARSGEPDAALHLSDLLERLPALAPHHRYSLLLPSREAPASYDGVTTVAVPTGKGEWARLWLEQRRLPRAAASLRADLLYFSYPAAPLASPVPLVAWSGCGGARLPPRGPVGRLRAGLGFAGLRGATATIFSAPGGPASGSRPRLLRVPPMVPRAFTPGEQGEDRGVRENYGLPPVYVLADGVRPEEVELLLAGWTWVDSTMGDSVALVVLGQSKAVTSAVRSQAATLRLEASVRAVERVKADHLPAIYRGAEAFLFAGWSCGGETVRRALASGMAIVGVENKEAAELLARAGYLVPARDARLLGAACITVLVEPEMRERQRGQARERGARLTADGPLRALLGHLEDVVEEAAPANPKEAP